jgi:hypothetical protein
LEYWGVCASGRDLIESAYDNEKSGQNAKPLRISNLNWVQDVIRVREKVELKAKLVGMLANIDGCVVLDNDLKVLGFGSKIGVSKREIKPKDCYDLGSNRPIDINNFGTRHQSTYRLCAKRPGTLAFVVSQDGNLRLFYGENDKVTLCEAIARLYPEGSFMAKKL